MKFHRKIKPFETSIFHKFHPCGVGGEFGTVLEQAKTNLFCTLPHLKRLNSAPYKFQRFIEKSLVCLTNMKFGTRLQQVETNYSTSRGCAGGGEGSSNAACSFNLELVFFF